MAGAAELTTLCARARQSPLASRGALHDALTRAELAFLAVPGSGEATEMWAERDPLFGAVWVPVFSRPGLAEAFAEQARSPRTPPLAAAHAASGHLFDALLDVPMFAGVRLDPDPAGAVRLERHDVAALSDGRLPAEAPALHGLDAGTVAVPEGVPCRFGEADPDFGPAGRRAVFPTAPGFTLEDFRCLVALELGGATAWAPCRNLAAALASAPAAGCETRDEPLLDALTAFGMYGEAEAVCARRLGEPARRAWALGRLSCVLRRAGRLERCVEHCRAALAEAPGEARLHRSLTLAFAELEDLEAAREAAREGLRRFPDDPTLARFA